MIAIVEGSSEIAELIKNTLHDEPAHQAAVVDDGARARAVLQSVRGSPIPLDYQLPSRTGCQIQDLLQQDPATAAIPVLFPTAGGRDPLSTARDFTNVLARPVDLATFRQAVARIRCATAKPAEKTESRTS